MSPRPEQPLRADHVENGARIDLRTHRKGDARRDVRFNEPGDDVDRRTLRRDDEMDAGGARELREPADRRLDLRGRDRA